MWITCRKLWITYINWGKVDRMFEKPPRLEPPNMGALTLCHPYIERVLWDWLFHCFCANLSTIVLWTNPHQKSSFFSAIASQNTSEYNPPILFQTLIHLSPGSTTTTKIYLILILDNYMYLFFFPNNLIYNSCFSI